MERIALGAVMMIVACGGGTPPPPKQADRTTTPPVQDPPPREPRPLKIEVTAPVGAWVEPAVQTPIEELFSPETVAALGKRSAVLSTRAGWFGASLDLGVTGPLAIPANTVWIGVGGKDDQVLAVRSDGSLLAAASTRAAVDGFSTLGKVKGATAWATADRVIVAATGDRVHVSRDGKRFKAKRVAKGFAVTALFARNDGVIVAQGTMPGEEQPVTFVSKAGASWKRSSFQPYDLVQDGSLIRTVDDCPSAVLAADSVDWVEEPPPDGTLAPLTEMLWYSNAVEVSEADRWLTTAALLPPAYDPRRAVTGEPGPCGIRHGSGKAGAHGYITKPADYLSYIRGKPGRLPAETRTALALFDDGGPTRSPHALAFDRVDGTARAIEPPPGCYARWAEALLGLPVLICEAGTVLEAFALHDDGWRSEGVIGPTPRDLKGIGIADDGTALLYTCIAGACEVALRVSGTPGEGRWQPLPIPGAVVFRPLIGGEVIALVVEPAREPSSVIFVSVVRVSPGRAPEVLVSGVRIAEQVNGFEVEHGEVHLLLDAGSRTVMEDGTLR